MNNKKTDITTVIFMSIIGFGIGGGVSIISSTPFLLTTLSFTTVCAVISASQTELISEAIKKINKNIKKKNSNIELHSATIEHVKELAKENYEALEYADESLKKDTCPQIGKKFYGTKEEVQSELELYQRLLDSGIIDEATKEEQGPVKKLARNK